MQVISIAGALGKDAVFKSTQQGHDLCTFPVAVSTGFGDKKATTWFDVTKWGKGSDKLASFLTKGTKVSVSGELGTREHEGKTYLQIRADHVTLQSSKSDTGNGGGGYKAPAPSGGGFDDDLDDDVPFASNDVRHEGRVR